MRVPDPRAIDGVLLCRSPLGSTLLEATWALNVVPSSMPHRGPGMSEWVYGLFPWGNTGQKKICLEVKERVMLYITPV
jgi:hypothetical protein